MELKIDGAKIKDIGCFHSYIKDNLDLPDYYGENLDGLWDLLNELNISRVTVTNNNKLKKNLGKYYDSVIGLFIELGKNMDDFTLDILEVDNED